MNHKCRWNLPFENPVRFHESRSVAKRLGFAKNRYLYRLHVSGYTRFSIISDTAARCSADGVRGMSIVSITTPRSSPVFFLSMLDQRFFDKFKQVEYQHGRYRSSSRLRRRVAVPKLNFTQAPSHKSRLDIVHTIHLNEPSFLPFSGVRQA
jgi:hypothetical protein